MDCEIKKDSKAFAAYGKTLIAERHRHRYEFNSAFSDIFDDNFICSGWNPQTNLVEIVELKNHPWFIACQYHPEFVSRPERAHPLFREFIGAALKAR